MTASTIVFVTPVAIKGVGVVDAVVPVVLVKGGLLEQALNRLAINAVAKSLCWQDGII
jgi:hypothetical protein